VKRRLRLRDQGGFSLVEMIVVVAILGIVLSGITIVFVSGTRAEVQVNDRFQAQEAARLALAAIRQDAHAACAASVTVVSGQPQLKLSIPIVDRVANPPTAPDAMDQCGTINSHITKIMWCVATSPTNSAKFALYRSTTGTCNSTGKLVADNLVNNLPNFTAFFSVSLTATGAINPGETQTVDVEIPVTLKVGTLGAPYDLKERVALPNTVWVATSGQACAVGAACRRGPCPPLDPLGQPAPACYPPHIS
jgi:prepilin-type N-terminal cleavage/methylation domain-containing protein